MTTKKTKESKIGKDSIPTYNQKLLENSKDLIKNYRKQNNAESLLEALNDNPTEILEKLKNLSQGVTAEEERETFEHISSSLRNSSDSGNKTIYHMPGSNNPKRRTPEWLDPYKKQISQKEKSGILSIAKLIEFKRLQHIEEVKGNIKPKDGSLTKIQKKAENSIWTKNLNTNWVSSIESQRSGFLESAKSAYLYWSEPNKSSEEAKMHLNTLRKESDKQTIDVFKTIDHLKETPEEAQRLHQIAQQLSKCDDIEEQQELEREALVLLNYDKFKGDENDPEYENNELRHAMKNTLISNYMDSDKDIDGNIDNTQKKAFWDSINKTLENDINNPEVCLKTFTTLQIFNSEKSIEKGLNELRKEDTKVNQSIEANNTPPIPLGDVGKAVINKGAEAAQKIGHEFGDALRQIGQTGDDLVQM